MIKIGIIGSGFGLYGLLPAFSNLNGCRVIAFCGKQTDRVLKNCEEYGVPNLYENWEEMLDSEDLDAVAIAVVPDIQYDICLAAIKKGIAVFAEKPLAISVKQAKELVKLSQKQKITNCVDFIFPEAYAFGKLKEFLIEEKFGTISNIDLQWDFLSYDIKNKRVSWKTDPQRGGGALSFYFSHCLYYLEWLFGPMIITEVSFEYSSEGPNSGEVGLDCSVTFVKNTIRGKLHISCNAKQKNVHLLSGRGEKGSFMLENSSTVFDAFLLETFDQSGQKIETIKDESIKIGHEDDRVRLVQKIGKRFIESCQNKLQMTPSFFDGLRVQQLISEIRTKNEKNVSE